MIASDRFERISDWLNPIHIREVRQDLRGKGFRNSFWFTICVATVIGVAIIALDHKSSDVGQSLFIAAFACLAFATCVIIPFTAFNTVGAEWDEKTQDLLVMSNLKPRQIVAGKFFSAMTQAILFYSALGPFLVFAYLLRGIDISLILTALWVCFTQCSLLTIVAISFSSLAKNKALRVLMTAILVIFLLYSLGLFSTLSFAGGLGLVGSTGTWTFLFLDFVSKAAIGVFAFAIACTRFAHPEENRSTPLRVLVMVFSHGLLFAHLIFPNIGGGSFSLAGTRFLSGGIFGPALGVLLVGSLFFMTEREELGRRVRAYVPRARLSAFFLSPLYPGGGRGMAYFTLNGLLLLFIVAVVNLLSGRGTDGGVRIAMLGFLYAIAYLGLPFGLMSRLSANVSGRVAVLLMGLAFTLVANAAAFFITFMTGGNLNDPRPWDVLNVVVSMRRLRDGELSGMSLAAVAIAALVALLVNAPRVARGVREVQLASRALREKDRGDGPPVPTAEPLGATVGLGEVVDDHVGEPVGGLVGAHLDVGDHRVLDRQHVHAGGRTGLARPAEHPGVEPLRGARVGRRQGLPAKVADRWRLGW